MSAENMSIRAIKDYISLELECKEALTLSNKN